jgi:hypothetical protein
VLTIKNCLFLFESMEQVAKYKSKLFQSNDYHFVTCKWLDTSFGSAEKDKLPLLYVLFHSFFHENYILAPSHHV